MSDENAQISFHKSFIISPGEDQSKPSSKIATHSQLKKTNSLNSQNNPKFMQEKDIIFYLFYKTPNLYNPPKYTTFMIIIYS